MTILAVQLCLYFAQLNKQHRYRRRQYEIGKTEREDCGAKEISMNENMPTLREELDRKAVEAMEFLVASHQQGKIAQAELHTGLEAIWNTTAGLISSDITHLLAAMLDHIKEGIVIKRLFVSAAQEPVMIEHNLTSFSVKVNSQLTYSDGWKKSTLTCFDDKVSPSVAAKEHFEKIAAALVAKGYREVT